MSMLVCMLLLLLLLDGDGERELLQDPGSPSCFIAGRPSWPGLRGGVAALGEGAEIDLVGLSVVISAGVATATHPSSMLSGPAPILPRFL